MTAAAGSPSVVRRTCRRVGLDRNPMRRREDRVQLAVAAVLTVLFLIIAPLLSMAVGGRIYQNEDRLAKAQAAQLHPVEATVVEVGKAPLYAPITPARVQWKDALGVAHTSDYQATGLVKAGATVKIWLDSSGKVTEPPSSTRALSKALLITTGLVFAIGTCFGGGYALLRRGLDRRRARLWEAEWATVERTWGNHGTRPDQA
ncbi:Rv1733c family protein [Nocardia sp. CA-129566]|uniref:Rv1733c family protein n=1 Tax=Nocardia sp. CA-129566 TaxID=3239976 RepID=UPI003D998AB6